MPRTTEIQTSSSVGTRSVLLFTPVPSVSQGSPLPFPQPNFHLEVNGFLQLVGTILLRTRLPPLVFTHSVPSTASHWPFASPSAEHCSQPCAPVGLAARWLLCQGQTSAQAPSTNLYTQSWSSRSHQLPAQHTFPLVDPSPNCGSSISTDTQGRENCLWKILKCMLHIQGHRMTTQSPAWWGW